MAASDVFAKIKKMIVGGENEAFLPEISPETTAVTLPQETDGDYKDRCVLVGVVKNPLQFDLLIKRKFYHIPLSQVNECEFPVKYVAIYQSKRYFGKKSGVKVYGEVESFTTVKRSEIKEIPRDSSEKYLYFKIKRWRCLENKIEAKEMEKTAISTSLYLLTNSRDSAELNIRTREEHLLYRKLVNTVKRLVITRTPDGNDIVYRDYTVKFMGGMLYLYFADVLEYVVGYDIFLENPTYVIRDIFDYYPEL